MLKKLCNIYTRFYDHCHATVTIPNAETAEKGGRKEEREEEEPCTHVGGSLAVVAMSQRRIKTSWQGLWRAESYRITVLLRSHPHLLATP